MVNLQIIGYNTIKMSISWEKTEDGRPKTEENEELKKKANS